MESKETIYIVGAGIGGLIAAFELEKAGYAPIVLEKSNGVGGRVRTVSIGDHHLDIGFQVLLDGYPMAKNTWTMMRLIFDAWLQGTDLCGRKTFCNWRSLRDFKMLIPTITAKIGGVGDKMKVLRSQCKDEAKIYR